MRTIKCLVFLLLFVLISSTARAQSDPYVPNCPTGKVCVVFLWVNGILVPNEPTWRAEVGRIMEEFHFKHQYLNRDYIRFDSSYNKSEQWIADLLQSSYQWTAQEVDAVFNLSSLLSLGLTDKLVNAIEKVSLNLQVQSDHDLFNLVNKTALWLVRGYTVVLVGHSQGTFYTNAAYNAFRYGSALLTTGPIGLPDPSKLVIVNIASAATYPADGRGKYTSQCGDLILGTPLSPPANVNNTTVFCDQAIPPAWLTHILEDSYMSPGLKSQVQIYKHLEESIPPTMTLTPSTNVATVSIGKSVTVNLTLASQDGTTGNPTLTLFCSGSCPAGFSYNYPSGSTRTLPANGTISIPVTFNVSSSAAFSTSNFRYEAALNGFKKSATIAVTVAAPSTTGTVSVSVSGYTGSSTITCALNSMSVSVATVGPTLFGNQSPGTKTLSCNSVSGYTFSVSPASQNLVAGGTVPFVVTATPVSTPLVASCSANPAVINAGGTTTFTGTSTGGTGTKTVLFSSTAFYTSDSVVSVSWSASAPNQVVTATYTVTDSSNPKKTAVANCQVQIVATTGKIVINLVNADPSASTTCSINGGPVMNIIDSKSMSGQTPGSKTVSCTPPIGYTITSIAPSATQTLSAGGTITFTVNQKAPPAPVLSSLTVNTSPKVNTNISVTAYGSGFVSDTEAYFCTSTSTTSGCTMARISSRTTDGTQIKMKDIISNTARTLYIRVKNPSSGWSNYLTMVVIN